MSDTFVRSASVAPSSINEAERTVEVVWSTGAAVRRRDLAGPFLERLAMRSDAVDLSRLVGASVLDAHQQRELRNVLGVVQTAAVDGERGTATLRFSARPEVEPVWQDVRAGIIRHISVGYGVEKWSETTDRNTGERTRTAVRWVPHELSFVPIPADPAATVRHHEVLMDDQTVVGAEAETSNTETRTADQMQTRAAINAEIRSMARVAGLDQSFADTQIDAGATVDQARVAAFAAMAQRSGGPIRTEAPRVEITADHDEPSARCAQMGEALFARINPAHQLSEPARRYAYATPAEMARELLTLRGVAVTGMSPAAAITRSLHTTSDFAIILGDTVGRQLRNSYQAAPSGIRQLGRQTSARDFRAKTSIQLSEAPTLLPVSEHGEFKAGSMAEAKESYSIDTFGRLFGISRQALVNDDLGAFADLSRRFGQAAAEFEAQFLVDLLTKGGNGPTMDDGKALFHADHGNKAGAGAVISDTALSAARLAMRTQKGLNSQLISVTPKFLVVPAALETQAEKILASIYAAKSADVNPFSGSLSLVVEPRLDAKSTTRWYVTADPSEIDGLEYAYLAGAEGPVVETKAGFEVDGVQIRVRLDYGAGFLDHRGWYANQGA